MIGQPAPDPSPARASDESRARVPRSVMPFAVGVSVVVSVASLWAVVAFARPPETVSREDLCRTYAELSSALDTRSLGNQVRFRRLAAQLSSEASRYPVIPLPDSMPAREAAESLRVVLDSSYATDRDLLIAARPVAAECGVDWRTGSTWTYDQVDPISR